MRLKRHLSSILLATFALLTIGCADLLAAGGGHGHGEAVERSFPHPTSEYLTAEAHKAEELGRDLTLIETLKVRAGVDPFNVVVSVIFFLAICHTFVAGKFQALAHKYEHEHEHKLKSGEISHPGDKEPVSFKGTLFHFLGEVEAIFGLWVIPLIIAITMSKGWHEAEAYVSGQNFTEPMVVVVLMAIAGSRPIVQSAERAVSQIAGIGGRSPGAYWFSVLTIAPLLGSFITEPAAMTIAAILLGQQFYKHNPSSKLKYATIGLLFVNVSVGGTLTHFAAPPVLMVASKWGWDLPFMFTHYGWKAIIGIATANVVYYSIFKKEFATLKQAASQAPKGEEEHYAPVWIAAVHALFLVWTILTLHYPPLFIGGFLFFIAFTMATDHHQYQINMKSPMLVGFFLAGLVIHGGLQGWWISPVLSSLGNIPLFIGATVLTAFNDNAAITYLASQVPLFNEPGAVSDALRYAVVAGAVTGGGLTVIANAPNPAGQSLLSKFFEGGISPLKLMMGALFPTIVMALCFMLLPG
ncbi:putative Na+/H+ antiporter [Pelagicoccus albus]|uniref:Putative Na+/H+ antiporter n=1 Tax=Pelagicoccus albus TaxID=415222 RepID=A0A7X1EBT9_9BACT|nr:putative Na+/H+ antiporter [Pelagicoccus albus]MBC2608167.1 putative Na+/H+ antiporter [Pelagicoccus albus]